ncbi:MAG: hypothetical protein LBV06_08500 [Propionibacteriaceae bacterium]|jgi:hypothetical protein|nr:hypothetical protein [Propionibacteriaceae bacterium]
MAWEVVLCREASTHIETGDPAQSMRPLSLGQRSEVMAAITAVFPSTVWHRTHTSTSVGAWFSPNGSIEFDLGSTPRRVEMVTMLVRATTTVVPDLLRLARQLDCEVLDLTNRTIISDDIEVAGPLARMEQRARLVESAASDDALDAWRDRMRQTDHFCRLLRGARATKLLSLTPAPVDATRDFCRTAARRGVPGPVIDELAAFFDATDGVTTGDLVILGCGDPALFDYWSGGELWLGLSAADRLQWKGNGFYLSGGRAGGYSANFGFSTFYAMLAFILSGRDQLPVADLVAAESTGFDDSVGGDATGETGASDSALLDDSDSQDWLSDDPIDLMSGVAMPVWDEVDESADLSQPRSGHDGIPPDSEPTPEPDSQPIDSSSDESGPPTESSATDGVVSQVYDNSVARSTPLKERSAEGGSEYTDIVRMSQLAKGELSDRAPGLGAQGPSSDRRTVSLSQLRPETPLDSDATSSDEVVGSTTAVTDTGSTGSETDSAVSVNNPMTAGPSDSEAAGPGSPETTTPAPNPIAPDSTASVTTTGSDSPVSVTPTDESAATAPNASAPPATPGESAAEASTNGPTVPHPSVEETAVADVTANVMTTDVDSPRSTTPTDSAPPESTTAVATASNADGSSAPTESVTPAESVTAPKSTASADDSEIPPLDDLDEGFEEGPKGPARRAVRPVSDRVRHWFRRD